MIFIISIISLTKPWYWSEICLKQITIPQTLLVTKLNIFSVESQPETSVALLSAHRICAETFKSIAACHQFHTRQQFLANFSHHSWFSSSVFFVIIKFNWFTISFSSCWQQFPGKYYIEIRITGVLGNSWTQENPTF